MRDEEEDKEFGERLASVRKARGDTQLDLAKALNVHPAQVSRWENGTRGPTASWYRKILRHYNDEANTLIYGADLPDPNPSPALAKYLATTSGKIIAKHGKVKLLSSIAHTLAAPNPPTEATYSRVGALILQDL